MFSSWRQEKATTTLIGEAEDLAEKLAIAKPHMLESHAAAARFWAAFHLSNGLNLHELVDCTPADVARFTAAAEAKIAALRKQRDYASSDGLAIWLHTARAVKEPRIAPAVREIWLRLSEAGQNADAMAEELMQDAGLPPDHNRSAPQGFRSDE